MLRRTKNKRIHSDSADSGPTLVEQPKSLAELTDEQIVFGGSEDVIERLERSLSANKKRKQIEETELKPAWLDEDDISSVQFEKAVGARPEWASLKQFRADHDDDSDPDSDELLRSTGNYLASSDSLPSGVIEMQKCSDINKDRPIKGKMKCVEFHPTAQVAMTGGMDCTLSLFQVDGRHNQKIQSVFVERFPIYAAHFSPDGNNAYLGSKSKSFYDYDLIGGRVSLGVIRGVKEEHKNTKQFIVSPDGRYLAILGRDGYIHLVSARSKEFIESLKMNGNVESVAFNSDGSRLFSSGDGGDVYVWNMNTRSCIHRFVDDGCVQGSSLAISPADRYIATGSSSGVVNIYEYSTATVNKEPQPVKAIMNLSTSCTSLEFNATSEILAIASNMLDGAVKLVHVPSLTVFSNFPAFNERLYIPSTLDFSVNSGYLTIGNNKGQALLYRVKHYADY